MLCAAIGASCDSLDDGVAAAALSGQVWFVGPVGEGARVHLHRTDASGVMGEEIAQALTDAAGRFQFEGLTGFGAEGDLLVSVELRDTAWVDVFGHRGVYDRDDVLRAPVLALASTEQREVVVTPFTTLVMAAVDARRIAGQPRPLAPALEAMRLHLTLAPADTPIEAVGETLNEARTHALLHDALVVLAARLGEQSGAGAAAFPATRLLRVLVEDASGAAPPGTLDGVGPDGALSVSGPSPVRLSGATLRAELVEALYDLGSTERWRFLEPRALGTLAAALTCSASNLFPDCTPFEASDDTPPSIGAPTPRAGSVQHGEIEITAVVRDPESGVQRVELRPVLDEVEGEPFPADAGLDGVYTFRVDTRVVQGISRLPLALRAWNHAGTPPAELRFEYAVENLGKGVVGGWVVKGPAAYVTVEAWGRDGALRTLITRGETDEAGRFTLEVPEWDQALELVARAGNDQGMLSGFQDEARGRFLRWREGDTLRALVPDYRREATDLRVVISPLTDLAWTLAQDKAARPGGRAPLVEYRDAVEAIGRHFGLDDPYESLQRRPPAPFDHPAAGGLGDAERFMLALGCVSQQALELAEVLNPDSVDAFNALDLQALYRADVQADGALDGRLGDAPVQVTSRAGRVVDLPADPFRHDLALACHRWLLTEGNPTGLDPLEVVDDLQALSANRDASLFGTAVAPAPFDDAPPILTAFVVRDGVEARLGEDEAGAWVEGTAAAPRVVGDVGLRFEAEDLSGLRAFEVLAIDAAPEGTVEVLERATLPARGLQRQAWMLHSERLPDGPWRARAGAEDALGHALERTLTLDVDNTAPVVTVTLPAPNAAGVDPQGRWHTRLNALDLRVAIRDHDEDTRVAAWLDATELGVRGRGLERDLTVPLLNVPEGEHVLRVSATDRHGHVGSATQALVVDRTPPAVAVEGSSYFDELSVGWPRHIDPSRRQYLDLDGGILRKWQTTWRADDENLPTVRLAISDAGTADALLTRTWQRCVGIACALGEPSPFTGDRVPLYASGRGAAGGLPFDPIGAPPATGTPVRMLFDVRDLAGNRSTVEDRLEMHVIPPPVVVVEQAPGGFTWDDLSFGDDSVARLFLVGGRQTVTLRQVTLTNPHAVPIRVRVRAPAQIELSVRVRALMPYFGQGYAFTPPACWSAIPLTVGDNRGSHFVAGACSPAGCTVAVDPCRPWQYATPSAGVEAEVTIERDHQTFDAESLRLDAGASTMLRFATQGGNSPSVDHLFETASARITGFPQIRYATDLQGITGVWRFVPPSPCFGDDCGTRWRFGRQIEAITEITAQQPDAPWLFTPLTADASAEGRPEGLEALPTLRRANSTLP